ncbi:hypothetical protein [Spirillospora sp. NPDC047279]|uniref:hypothetical protein n=1 Tax=Spirillospora sp. NPDC047279 TaxID=3155478 RepID=UPI0033D5EF2B
MRVLDLSVNRLAALPGGLGGLVRLRYLYARTPLTPSADPIATDTRVRKSRSVWRRVERTWRP